MGWGLIALVSLSFAAVAEHIFHHFIYPNFAGRGMTFPRHSRAFRFAKEKFGALVKTREGK